MHTFTNSVLNFYVEEETKKKEGKKDTKERRKSKEWEQSQEE